MTGAAVYRPLQQTNNPATPGRDSYPPNLHNRSMMRLTSAIALVLLLTGCEQPVPPVYEEPVPVPLAAEAGSLAPALSVGPDGRVLLSWIERRESGGELFFSTLGVERWEGRSAVVADPAMFVNWADYPAVHALGGDRLFAHWPSSSAAPPYAYDVLFSQSEDGGSTWSEPGSPHDDGTPTEHGFVSAWPAAAGVGLIWLDGRHTVDASTDGPVEKGMTLRSAMVRQDGTTANEQLVDDLVCDCCQTDVAVSSAGPIAVYRNRTVDEVRDIYVSRYRNGRWQPGEAFSEDGWTIRACPVNGPSIAAHDEHVAVAWYTGAVDSPRAYVRLSNNGGRTFGDKILIAARGVLGQMRIAWIGDNAFAVSWLEKGGDLNDVRVRSVTTAGDLGPVKTVGRTALRRTVPEMVADGERLVFTWTDEVNERTRLASASVRIVYAE